MRTAQFVLLAISFITLPVDATTPAAAARDTGFDPRVITFGEAREEIKSTPIEKRPYRPLHVYGNTVRRRNSRVAAPRPAGQR